MAFDAQRHSATIDAKRKRRAALARSIPCAKREWCVPLSLVDLDRPCDIEADNNTDQIAAHTESIVPASGRKQKKDQQHED